MMSRAGRFYRTSSVAAVHGLLFGRSAHPPRRWRCKSLLVSNKETNNDDGPRLLTSGRNGTLGSLRLPNRSLSEGDRTAFLLIW